MLPRKEPKPPDSVLSHWYAFIDGVHFSAKDFYASIEDELAARKIPRLKSTRPEFFEGTSFSDKRIYLRLARERWAFEVCAAPFGRGYFFSLRFVELPRGGWLQLLLILLGLWLGLSFVGGLLRQTNQYFWIVIGLAAAVGAGVWIVRKAGENQRPATAPVFAGEMPDFDTFLLNLPVLGEWYENLRKDTYYRHDTRLLYHTVVTEVVQKRVEEFIAAKGVKLLKTYDYNPILGELYKKANVDTEREDDDRFLPQPATD
jgi:hypothetical protein